MALMRVSVAVLTRDLTRAADPTGLFWVSAAAIEDDGRTLVLDVTGPGVPDVPEVQAIVHVQPPMRVEFQPVERRPRTVQLDGRGDAAPRNPEDDGA